MKINRYISLFLTTLLVGCTVADKINLTNETGSTITVYVNSPASQKDYTLKPGQSTEIVFFSSQKLEISASDGTRWHYDDVKVIAPVFNPYSSRRKVWGFGVAYNHLKLSIDTNGVIRPVGVMTGEADQLALAPQQESAQHAPPAGRGEAPRP